MENNCVKVLIGCTKSGEKTARKFEKIYREKFEVIYEDTFAEFDDIFKRAESEGLTHILYFQNDRDALLSIFADDVKGYTLEINTDDLMKVLSGNAD